MFPASTKWNASQAKFVTDICKTPAGDACAAAVKQSGAAVTAALRAADKAFQAHKQGKERARHHRDFGAAASQHKAAMDQLLKQLQRAMAEQKVDDPKAKLDLKVFQTKLQGIQAELGKMHATMKPD